ncbi:MAG: AcrR family transcriptional regulator [Parvicella sp.]|jgi:AcrR family transcriptional regulator
MSEATSLLPSIATNYRDYETFKGHFAYQGSALYNLIFDRNADYISVKKRHVATASLQKLFDAAFMISSKIGFHEMSLRDLSRETSISMGSIYACIGKKENIAIIVKDLINTLSQQNLNAVIELPSAIEKLETYIRLQFYTSSLLRPWYAFLYMETRCLPQQHQEESKSIELRTISNLEKLIRDSLPIKALSETKISFLANTILALLQDWYLKPWKHSNENEDIECYFDNILFIAQPFLRLPS